MALNSLDAGYKSKELTLRGRERGGSHIHSFVFTDRNNNRFQKKFMMQNTDIEIFDSTYRSSAAPVNVSFSGVEIVDTGEQLRKIYQLWSRIIRISP